MEYFFDTREEASRAAAERISNALTRRMDGNGAASLVVSGGTTPAATFAELAATPLEWSKVHVVMSDERWVPANHEDSNEKLVRDTLLTGKAADATLLPVYSDDVQPDERCEQLQEELKLIPFPFACSLLGMGEDGHTASLFPGDQHSANESVHAVNGAPKPPSARVSLSRTSLSNSQQGLVLVSGASKHHALQRWRAGVPLPIATITALQRLVVLYDNAAAGQSTD